MSYSPAIRFGGPGVSRPMSERRAGGIKRSTSERSDRKDNTSADSSDRKTKLVELLSSTTRTVVQNLSMAGRINQMRKRAAEDQARKRAAQALLQADAEDQQPTSNRSSTQLLSKVMEFAGKRIFKAIARPILRFAMRAAMQVVRFALQGLMRYVLIPVLQTLVTLIVANPVTALIGAAVLAVGGTGYYLWSKFFKADTAAPISPVADVESPATTSTSVESSTPALPAARPVLAPKASIMDEVTQPIRVARNLIKNSKFAGFGDDVDRSIAVASKEFGLPVDVFRGFIKMEAGWTGAMSPTGAIGAGQFTQGTWDDLAKTKDGKAIGMTVIGKRFRKDDDPRRDKHMNIMATALLARNNAAKLKANGLPVTGENLYMMHNIGPGIMDVMLGKPASPSTLRAMQLNGMLKGQTATEYLAYQKGRFNTQYAIANSVSTVTETEVPRQADAIAVDRKAKATRPVMVAQSADSSYTPPVKDREIVRGKGKTLIEVH